VSFLEQCSCCRSFEKISAACPFDFPLSIAIVRSRACQRRRKKLEQRVVVLGPRMKIREVARRAIRVGDLLDSERFATKLKSA